MIKAGDKVTIKPEYQDAGDSDFEWVALEDEDGGHLSISPMGNLWLIPSYFVKTEWVDRVEK